MLGLLTLETIQTPACGFERLGLSIAVQQWQVPRAADARIRSPAHSSYLICRILSLTSESTCSLDAL